MLDDVTDIPSEDEVVVIAPEPVEEISIASDAMYRFRIFGLEPGETQLHITDAEGKKVSLPVTISPKVVHLRNYSQTYWMTKNSVYRLTHLLQIDRTYVYAKRRSRYWRLYGGRRQGSFPMKMRIYNYHEKKYQPMEYTIYVGTTA